MKLLFLSCALILFSSYAHELGNKSITKHYGDTAITAPLKQTTSVVLDVLTVYNPVVAQCNIDPLKTASLKEIDVFNLKAGQVRWMALSRDLLSRWNGLFQYGDSVRVNANDPAIDGVWVIQDTMNKRHQKRGDLLFHQDIRSTGKWTNVVIEKIVNS